MDISSAAAAKSDQLNAIDLVAGPVTVTIVEVKQGSVEQPVNIITDAFGAGRPFKPSKTVLRIILGAWGKETDDWIGRQLTIYRDPEVKWAGQAVGGIRISAMSDIPKALNMTLATSAKTWGKYSIQPLTAAPAVRDWLAELKQAGDNVDAITALGKAARTANAPQNIIDTITTEYHRATEGTK